MLTFLSLTSDQGIIISLSLSRPFPSRYAFLEHPDALPSVRPSVRPRHFPASARPSGPAASAPFRRISIYLLSSSKDKTVSGVLRTVGDRRCSCIGTMRCCELDCGCWEDPDAEKKWRDAPAPKILRETSRRCRDPGSEVTSRSCPARGCDHRRGAASGSGGATTDSGVLAPVAVVVAVAVVVVAGVVVVGIDVAPAVATGVASGRKDAKLVRCVLECVRRKCPHTRSSSRNRFRWACRERPLPPAVDRRNSRRGRPPSSPRWGTADWRLRRRRRPRARRRDKSRRKEPSYWRHPWTDDDDRPIRWSSDIYEKPRS